MIVSCKRLLGPYEDLLEPLHKRYRTEGPLAGPEEIPGYTCGLSASSVERRRHHLEDDCQGPAEKRLRVGSHDFLERTESSCSGARADAGAGADSAREAREAREAGIHTWAEDIVKALHGCPSVEEAIQRCARSLGDFESEVRQKALAEAEDSKERGAEDSGRSESGQSLQHTNKVLMRAVHHLAERCRRQEASASEADELRQALEQAQDRERRLQHANEVLQGHLKLHLDSVSVH